MLIVHKQTLSLDGGAEENRQCSGIFTKPAFRGLP